MSTLTLIRHGQANTTARDELSYDKLSELGAQQAAWLGAHLLSSNEHFERVYCGTMRRHKETAAAMGSEFSDRAVADARLNEMDVFAMAQLLHDQQGIAMPVEREDFVTFLPLLMAKWQQGEIAGVSESFQQFEARTQQVIDEIHSGRGSAIIVSSGGFIGMALRQSLRLDVPEFSRLCASILNSSVHRLHRVGDGLMMTQFNAVPHLDHPNRQFAQTHL